MTRNTALAAALVLALAACRSTPAPSAGPANSLVSGGPSAPPPVGVPAGPEAVMGEGPLVIEAESAAVPGVFDVGEDGGRGCLVAAVREGKDQKPAVLSFTIPEEGVYLVEASVRPLAPGKGDSFYVALDDGKPQRFNVSTPADWEWKAMPVSEKRKVELSAGRHEIRILPREAGAKIDQIRITKAGGAGGPGATGAGDAPKEKPKGDKMKGEKAKAGKEKKGDPAGKPEPAPAEKAGGAEK